MMTTTAMMPKTDATDSIPNLIQETRLQAPGIGTPIRGIRFREPWEVNRRFVELVSQLPGRGSADSVEPMPSPSGGESPIRETRFLPPSMKSRRLGGLENKLHWWRAVDSVN